MYTPRSLEMLAIYFLAVLLMSGNVMAQNVAEWTSQNGGHWSDGSNWDTGDVPVSTAENPFDALIDLDSLIDFTILADQNSIVRNLTVDSQQATVVWDAVTTGSSLEQLGVENLIDLIAGTLRIGSDRTIEANELRIGSGVLDLESLATFDGTKISGDFATRRNSIQLKNGATIAGDVDLRNNSSIRTVATSPEENSIRFDDSFILLSNSEVIADDNTRITLGANSKISGLGSVGAAGAGTFINEGDIFASVRDKVLNLVSGIRGSSLDDAPSNFINRGLIRARNGASLVISGVTEGLFVNETGGRIVLESGSQGFIASNWSSRGRIDVRSGAELIIDAGFTTEDLQSIVPRVNSAITVRNIDWNNRGQSINFDRRAEQFLFDRTTISGGVIFARNSPLRLDGRVTFNDLRYVGDILVDSNFHTLDASNVQLVGGAKLDGTSPSIFFRDSDLSEATQFELVNTGASLKIENENSVLRWNAAQSIIGAGVVQINGEGQSLRNFGTIEANLTDSRLRLLVAEDSGDFASNRGLMHANNGGILRINSDLGLIYNHADGAIRAGENSTVEIFADRFVNDGTIELLENSSLILDGEYTNSLIESITHETETASIFLDGQLNLEDDEVFIPSERYVIRNHSQFDGGTIDFSRSNPLGTTTGKFSNTVVDGDVRVTNSNSVDFSGVTTTSGNIRIDDGSVRFLDESVAAGTIDVDGPDSVLRAHSNFTTAGTEIVLRNGAQMEIGFGRWFTLSEGASISGNGFVSLAVPQSSIRFTNQGTIEASGPNGLLSLSRDWADRDEFINNGVMTIRDGGIVNTGKYTRQFEADAKVLLDDGTWAINGSLLVTDGEISGNGLIEAELHYFYGGKISPGVSTGHLNFVGNILAGPPIGIFENMASGEVEMLFDIAGTEQGEVDGYDLLSIDGNLNLGIGELFRLSVNTSPEISIEELLDTEFAIIEIAEEHELLGTFNNVISGGYLTTLDNRFDFQVFYGADSSFGSNQVVLTNFSVASAGFSLTAVPEPSALLLLAFASTAIASRRRRV